MISNDNEKFTISEKIKDIQEELRKGEIDDHARLVQDPEILSAIVSRLRFWKWIENLGSKINGYNLDELNQALNKCCQEKYIKNDKFIVYEIIEKRINELGNGTQEKLSQSKQELRKEKERLREFEESQKKESDNPKGATSSVRMSSRAIWWCTKKR